VDVFLKEEKYMPKLLQINVTANWGSTGKIAEQIGLKAMEHGWESYIAYGRDSNPSKSKLIKVGNMLNVYEHYLENRLFDNEGLASRIPTKRFIRQIEEIKPDIIHLHNIHDHWLNYKILFEYFNSIDTPIVWTQHDCWAFSGGCMHFVHTNCEKWKNECEKCPQKSKSIDRSKIHFNLRKNFFSNVNLTLVSVSQWMGNFLQESFLKNKKIEVIHNGVDLNVFKPISDNKGKNKFQILAVSSVWHRSKGLYDVFKLRELLSEEYEITMIGLSADQVKQLPKGIIGIQRTQNIQELVKLYSESDVFINPTYADTFPTVNLEALACGTPVITYKTGGSPEAVDENTGVVIAQGDINAIAETIRQIKLNPLSSEACRKRAVELYDKNKCFDKYIDLYEKLLEISCMK
jgi:glycosyltransferase involved in cell wall biosynthesis